MTRVATFNLHHGAPSVGRADINATARACAALDVELLALQELDVRRRRSGFRHQPRAVAEACGLNVVHAIAVGSGRSGYGTALLSRLPLGAVQFLGLPGAGTERRVAILGRTELAGGPVTVAAVHLQPRLGLAELQLDAVLGAVRRRPGPHLVLGDLNLGPATVLAVLRRHGFRTPDAPPTFPASGPTDRIDWIAARGLAVSDPVVPDVLTSDHRPLVATVELAR